LGVATCSGGSRLLLGEYRPPLPVLEGVRLPPGSTGLCRRKQTPSWGVPASPAGFGGSKTSSQEYRPAPEGADSLSESTGLPTGCRGSRTPFREYQPPNRFGRGSADSLSGVPGPPCRFWRGPAGRSFPRWRDSLLLGLPQGSCSPDLL
jgi:hypothetical protein